MKKILVVGEINVDLICQDCGSFPEPGKKVLVDDRLEDRSLCAEF